MIFQQALILALIIAIPAILLLKNIDTILLYAAQPKHIIELVHGYFRGFIWGLPALLLLTVFQHFSIGIKQTKIMILTGKLGLIVGTLLGFILAFGSKYNSSLGINGIGIAQAVRFWVCLVIILVHFHQNIAIKSLSLFAHFHCFSTKYVKLLSTCSCSVTSISGQFS